MDTRFRHWLVGAALCTLLLCSSTRAQTLANYQRRLPTPEDFGAVGNGKADDTRALEQFFNSWNPTSARESVALALSPGKIYAFQRPIVITAGATKANRGLAYFRMVVQGNGATLLYTGGRGKGYALRFGDREKVKGSRCSVYDLHLSIGPRGADGGLLLDHHDFGVWQNVSVNGEIDEACIKVGRGYSLLLKQVLLTGGDVGLMAGIGEGSSVNAFHVEDGRIVNCRIGVHYSGTTFNFENLDCSVHSEACVQLDGSQYGKLHLYTEKVGPGTRSNDAAVVRMKNSQSIQVSGMLNAANGAITKPTHAGYCLDLKNCNDITISGRGYTPQTAYVRIDDACRNIVIDDGAACDFIRADHGFATTQPAPFADGIHLVNRAAIRLKDRHDPAAAPSLVPDHFDKWKIADSMTIGRDVKDYRGDGQSQVITFPARNTKAMRLSTRMEAQPEKYRIEARLRLVRFEEVRPENRETDCAVIYLSAKLDDQVLAEQQARIGEGWQDVWAEFTVAKEGTVQIDFGKVLGYEPCVVAVDFLRVVSVE